MCALRLDSQKSPDRADQFVRADGFSQDRGAPQRKAVDAGHDDHRHISRMRPRRELLPHGQTVEGRQANVEDHEIGLNVFNRPQRVNAIDCFTNLEIAEPEGIAEHPTQVVIVFNDQDNLAAVRRFGERHVTMLRVMSKTDNLGRGGIPD
jgi:hypothetical protein